MSFRILLIEDDVEISEFIAQGLREEGYVIVVASEGESARHELESSSWDLILLDWWLPHEDGLSLLKRFRTTNTITPVIFITARDAIAQRVEGLRAGADDYICKPFAFEELLARVQSQLRRQPNQIAHEWRHHDIFLDPITNRAERGGVSLNLTAREHALLFFFIRHPGEVISRTRLYEQVWEEQFDGLSNTLEVHIMELRKKLEENGARVIHTIRGRGYVLGEPSNNEGDE